MKVPYLDLVEAHAQDRQVLLEAVGRVLSHGQFILGPEVAELEQALSRRLSAHAVVGVSNGTDALQLALRLRGVGPGDEVITVSHSFFATAAAIVLVGARPVFVEVDEETMVLDPGAVEAALSSRTRAVLPVHLNGTPCDMDAISALCDAHGLELIEDCAQAIDASWGAQKVGTFGVGAFSLHPLKIFGACGDAGFVAVQGEQDAAQLRKLRNLGLRDRDTCEVVSGNYRLDTLQAAMLLAKLDALDGWQARRASHARAYREALGGVLRFVEYSVQAGPVYSCLAVRHPRRDRILSHARERGIDLKVHYPKPIHRQPAFQQYVTGELPVTEKVVSEIFSLPVSPQLSDAQRGLVVESVLEALGQPGVMAG